jgi:hypothetical protein
MFTFSTSLRYICITQMMSQRNIIYPLLLNTIFYEITQAAGVCDKLEKGILCLFN